MEKPFGEGILLTKILKQMQGEDLAVFLGGCPYQHY